LRRYVSGGTFFTEGFALEVTVDASGCVRVTAKGLLSFSETTFFFTKPVSGERSLSKVVSCHVERLRRKQVLAEREMIDRHFAQAQEKKEAFQKYFSSAADHLLQTMILDKDVSYKDWVDCCSFLCHAKEWVDNNTYFSSKEFILVLHDTIRFCEPRFEAFQMMKIQRIAEQAANRVAAKLLNEELRAELRAFKDLERQDLRNGWEERKRKRESNTKEDEWFPDASWRRLDV
jgi:hypothetical protein